MNSGTIIKEAKKGAKLYQNIERCLVKYIFFETKKTFSEIIFRGEGRKKMKLKRCFKTVLSSVLAAAMLITAVPCNLTLDVQAAPVETVVETEVATEESTVAAEDLAVKETSETATEEITTEVVVEETVKDEDVVDVTAYDISSGYWGPTIGENGEVTVYYYPENYKDDEGNLKETVTSVQLKGGWVADWSDYIDMQLQDDGSYSATISVEKAPVAKSFEYGFMPNSTSGWDVDDCNPNKNGNSKIERNPVKGLSGTTIYYYPEHGAYPSTVTLEYREKGSTGEFASIAMDKDEVYTAIYSVTLSETGEYEYRFNVAGEIVADTNNSNGLTDGLASFIVEDAYPAEDPNVKSPVVNGKEVTFNLYGPTYTSAHVAGNMPGAAWGTTDEYVMTYNEETAYWSLSKTLSAGKYEYKFITNGGTWMQDPLNIPSEDTNANCIFVITGLADAEENVTRGGSVALPATLKLYDAEGNSTDATVASYALVDNALAEKVTLATNEGVTTLTTAADLPAEVTTVELTATDANSNTSKVTVSVVDKVYNYTIYYYDPDHGMDDAALWVWQTNGAGATEPTYFTAEEVLADGNTWSKAEFKTSYSDISIIPRAYENWDWQDTTRNYVIEGENDSVTLYIVKDDGSKIYTELPEIVVAEKRYLVVEYVRKNGSAQNWYLYTWNSGYGSNVFVPFEKVGKKWVAKVPVKQGLDTLSYCIERATVEGETVTHWAEKDGGDHMCDLPVDQNVIKIVETQDKGITYVYPSNTGYEIDGENNTIHFYYRNDDAFLAGDEGGFYSVQVEIDGTAYDMKFDKTEQRYEYDLKGLKAGDYKYRYILKAEKNSEPEYVLDAFNEATMVVEDVEYSVCTYDSFEVDVTASMYREEMDYNDNNVLTVKLAGKNGVDISELKVKGATADLSAVGGSSKTSIDPTLLELSIAVKEGTSTGTKTIPVTVIDQYNNKYTASTTVKVVSRDKSGDFDWDEAVIYFTVTDRFFDGNESNNGAGYDISENGTSSYHGGDFAGLTEKLDYLKDLGVNTIWITPIVENEMADGLVTDVAGIKSWGYHGYWASDFEKLDSHLGTEEEFETLLNEAHNRGMKIMVDVVLNHAGYNNEDYFNNILKDEEDNPIRMIREGDEIVIGDDKKGPLSDLPDFLTENEEVRNLLVEWQSNWVSKYDIDYYRVDTVKHVDDTTWSAFKNALTKIDPDFKMIGEWAGGGYGTDAGMLNEGRMDSLLDFDFNGEATEFVKGDMTGTEAFMNARNAAIDNTATLGAFIGSHDEPGFAYALMHPEDGIEGVSEERAMNLTKVAASLQMTAKGQVVIYYGEELGQTGANNYPYQENRYDFAWDQVTEDNDMLNHYKKMLDIRNEYTEVFAKGARSTVVASNEGGFDIFAKSHRGTTVYTALNIGTEPVTYTLTGQSSGGSLLDLYSGKSYSIDGKGNVTITIPAAADGGTAVFVRDEFYVETVESKTFNGNVVTLDADELIVRYGSTELEAGKDYKVTYKNNKKVGTATVTVTGIGNYGGKETTTFEITQKNVADEDVIVTAQTEMIETGKALKPLTSVTFNGKKLGTKDYSVAYSLVETTDEGVKKTSVKTVKTAGDYEVTITGKGNYTGTKTETFKVYAKAATINIKSAKVKFVNAEGREVDKYSVAYTGSAIEPTVKVYVSNKLVDSSKYDVVYDDETNVSVGTSKVKIIGKSAEGAVGSVEKAFTITGTKLGDAAVIDETNWKKEVAINENTRVAEQTGVTLKVKGGDTEFAAANYEVSYLKNNKPGTATMVFTGKADKGYTGVIKKTFKVSQVTLSDTTEGLTVTVEPTVSYLKKGATAAVSVEYNGVDLVLGTDYKLKYKNNKAVTTVNMKENKKPVVEITFMGGFKGKITKKFEIVPTDLATMTVTAADAAYQNKKGKYMVTPVVTDVTGTKLVNKKDFTCTYYLVENAGDKLLDKNDVVDAGETVKVVIAAKAAGYTGETSTTYEIKVQDISKAKVVVNAQTYTGKAITLTADDFSTIKVGDTKLVEGKHYTIDQNSYKNNVNKGNATVVIKGMGNYGGTKTVTFKITSRTVAWWWNLLH